MMINTIEMKIKTICVEDNIVVSEGISEHQISYVDQIVTSR